MDALWRGTLSESAIRFSLAETAELCDRGAEIHGADRIAREIFAEALTTGALVSVLLSGREKYSLRFGYPGAAGTILIEALADGSVRGLLPNPHLTGVEGPIFGDLTPISVVKSDGGRVLNSGQVNSALASPAADAAFFFSGSDQIETEIAFAGHTGLMLQALPACDLERFGVLRRQMHTAAFTEALRRENVEPAKKIRLLFELLFGEAPAYTAEAATTPAFRCRCSTEGMKNNLRTLGKAELDALFRERKHPAVTCHFCNRTYRFSREEFAD